MDFFDNKSVSLIRKGYYSAVYFNRTKYILLGEKVLKKVTMQIFQKNEGSVLCGIAEVIELLKKTTGYIKSNQWIDKSKELAVYSLQDGGKVGGWESVMHITGPYAYFAHLESIYLGILARRTLVATNVRKAAEAAGGKKVIFFADRFDSFVNQIGDGYAARIGNASSVCTQAMGEAFGDKPVGTIPHALIAINFGDTVKAAKQFSKEFPKVPLIVLVDFDNDCVKTSIEVARELKNMLWGVRLDTSEAIIDRSLQNQRSKIKDQKLKGVNIDLVKKVRMALNSVGFEKVKIVVSGGFDAEKIKRFESEKTPVDVYGVGSSLLKGNNDFTADIVKVEGKFISKVGRVYKENKRLKRLL